jgi:hypothetical protein
MQTQTTNQSRSSLRKTVAKCLLAVGLLAATAVSQPQAQAGVSFQDPAGGWSYMFNGDQCLVNPAGLFDGSWIQGANSSWGLDARGANVGLPGGVDLTTNATLKYITVEDPLTDAASNNRRLYFIRSLTNGTGVAYNDAMMMFSNGVTLTFRARLTPISDPRLSLGYSNISGQPFERYAPNGHPVVSDGKSIFGLRSPANEIISFGLTMGWEDDADGQLFPGGGLIMNRAIRTAATGNVDGADTAGGTVPWVKLDPTAWHEYWITITNRGTATNGEYQVNVYLDGNTTPNALYTTAGTGGNDGVGATNAYLTFGLGSSTGSGAVDIDFIGFKMGALTPVAAAAIPPVMTKVNSFGGTNTIVVSFDQAVGDNALDLANYSVLNNFGVAVPLTSAYRWKDSSNVVLVSSATFQPGVTNRVFVRNVTNLLGVAVDVGYMESYIQPIFSSAVAEVYLGQSSTIATFIASPQFLAGKFDWQSYSNVFAFATGTGAFLNPGGLNNYGGRMTSFFVPPTNGNYVFWTRVDDNLVLNMNTNSVNSMEPSGKTQIALWAGNQQNYISGTGKSAPIFLEGGKKYFIEAIWGEGTGGDGFSVAYRAASDFLTPPNTEFIRASNLFLPQGQMAIDVAPPSTLDVQAGTSFVTLNMEGIRGSMPWSFQWQRSNGAGGFTNIPAGDRWSYTIPGAVMAAEHQGLVYRFTASNLFSVATADVTINVVADSTVPTVVEVSGGPNSNEVRVVFSEPMNNSFISDPGAYVIEDGANQIGVTPTILADNRTVILTDNSGQLVPGRQYTLLVSQWDGIYDASDANFMPETRFQFTASVGGTNGVLRRLQYLTMATGNNTLLTTFFAHPNFVRNLPSVADFLNTFNSPQSGGTSPGTDDYGLRMNGYIVPSVDGAYLFRQYSDDEGRFLLSTDASSRNVRRITESWTPGATAGALPATLPVLLKAGKRYYFEAYVKEGGGGDYLQVQWRRPTDGVWEYVPSANLLYTIDQNALQIDSQPVNYTTEAFNDATFTVKTYSSEGAGAVFYQWQQFDAGLSDFVNMVGATVNSATLVTNLLAADSGNQYRCIARVDLATGPLAGVYSMSLTSAVVTATVVSDVTSPTLVSVVPGQ